MNKELNGRSKKKRFGLPSLWAAFVGFIFTNLLISAVILFAFTMFMIRLGWITSEEHRPELPLVMLLILSTSIGSMISFALGKHVFKPIDEFSHAMQDVAKGNFDIQLSYNGRVQELSDMSSSFNAMVHDLGNIETLRSDFVVTVSHEFKTPLVAIEGYAAILQNPELTADEIKEYTGKILESTKQLSKLSSNVLLLSNLENKEIVTEKSEFRLDEQIRQSVLLLESLWENKKIDLNIDLEQATYFGNEELLMQVWQNIVGNAIKFTPKNGEISISLKKYPDRITVRIADTGIGIAPEVQALIFNKFYQGDASGYTDGNGLGLSLVKRIIDLNKGNVTVESVPGAGTAFTVELPAESGCRNH